jgi:diketogulonate reductase-like aldo/keto reductase
LFRNNATTSCHAQVATKFAPLPWRQTAASVPVALRESLARMRRQKTELYMIHW